MCRRIFIASAFLCSLAACGDGTFEFDGKCVAVDPNDNTAPTTTATPTTTVARNLPRSVELSTDEDATIYYTVDDSAPTTLAANTQTEKSETYTQDRAEPGDAQRVGHEPHSHDHTVLARSAPHV